MCIVRMLSLILLAAFLILGSLADFFGMQPASFGHFILGLCALGSGVMMFVALDDFVCKKDD